jgi:hypothetical protein
MCEAVLRGGTEERSARLSMIVIQGRLIRQANWPARSLCLVQVLKRVVLRAKETRPGTSLRKEATPTMQRRTLATIWPALFRLAHPPDGDEALSHRLRLDSFKAARSANQNRSSIQDRC